MSLPDPQQQGGDQPGASWRALSGDLPPVPSFGATGAAAAHQAQQVPAPIHGGWQGAWQDETGQWHYPFDAQQPAQQPPYAGAAGALAEPQPQPQQFEQAPESVPEQPEQPVGIVAPEQLAPVGPPRYLAPQRVVHDPRQRTMAAVITFVALVIALWGILGFLGSLSRTLSSINSGNAKLKLQMLEANKGLEQLDVKTRPLHRMASDSEELAGLLGAIDADMGEMLVGVDSIAAGMGEMGTSLTELDGSLATVNELNTSMSQQLANINTGLQSQLAKVQQMRGDVQKTGQTLQTLPPRLEATNARLTHVNGAVNTMGCRGITNNLAVKISLGPIPNGSATVYATVVPPGAWGTKQDGKTPC